MLFSTQVPQSTALTGFFWLPVIIHSPPAASYSTTRQSGSSGTTFTLRQLRPWRSRCPRWNASWGVSLSNRWSLRTPPTTNSPSLRCSQTPITSPSSEPVKPKSSCWRRVRLSLSRSSSPHPLSETPIIAVGSVSTRNRCVAKGFD